MAHHVGCDFFAGWFSGVAGILVGQPLDTMKVHQQVYDISITQAFKDIHRKAGLRGFYRGMTLPLLSSGILNSIMFGAYGASLGCIEDFRELVMSPQSLQAHRQTETYKHHHGSYLDVFMAGCAAGGAPIIIACPGDLIKVRCQAAESKETSTSWRVIKDVFKQEGISGFYRGLVPMLWRDIPSCGVYILSYEIIKDLLSKLSGHPSDMVQQFLAGGCAGTVSWISVAPFDTVKSQVQATHRDEKKVGMVKIMKTIVEEQGFRGLTRGIGLTCLRAFPVNAVTFVTYEHVYKRCAAEFRHKKIVDSPRDTIAAATEERRPDIECTLEKSCCRCRRI